jgi:hypothetical protein
MCLHCSCAKLNLLFCVSFIHSTLQSTSICRLVPNYKNRLCSLVYDYIDSANHIAILHIYTYMNCCHMLVLHVEPPSTILVQPSISLINQFNFYFCIILVSTIFVLEVQYRIFSLFFTFISISCHELVFFILLGRKEICLSKHHVLIFYLVCSFCGRS